jgi:gliding motility-associated-like protein
LKKTNLHKPILLLVFLIQCSKLFAQKEANIWYFGQNAGLNFNTNPPTALTNSVMNTDEGCTSIADKNGNLLFYSDGMTVWNKNHQIMTNGTGLLGDESSTHSALVIKYPGVDSMYIIFTSGGIGSSNGICYSIIDMKLSGQLGAVTTKNIKLVNVSAEKIAAIHHANLRDIWIAIPAYGTDSIYTFLVTPSGINLNAVKNRTGSLINFPSVGQIKFSNDATKLAFINRNYPTNNNNSVVVSDFNNFTGIISSTRAIFDFSNPYGLEFSPNSSYLYSTDFDYKSLYQCIIPISSTSMASACKTIDSVNYIGQLQLASDGNIYCSIPGSKYLGAINNPDDYYSSCGYLSDAIYLNGKTNNFGLPTFYQTFFSQIAVISSDTVCLGDSTLIAIKINSSAIDSIRWYIGDTIIPINNNTKVKQFKYLSNDTTTKTILAKVYFLSFVQNYYGSLITKLYPNLQLTNDTFICIGDSITLLATYKGAKYLWQDNTTDSTYLVKKSGLYWIKADYKGCVKYDSVNIEVRNLPIVNLGNDTTLCNNATLLLTAPTNYQSYLWNDLSKENTLLVSKQGMYLVLVTDSGCAAQDQINIYYLNTPNITLGKDTTICDGVPFYLKANSQKANYLWSDFSTDSIIQITQSGNYWVKVYNVCGSATDTAKIELIACNCYIHLPNAFTPNGNALNEVFLPVSNCEMINYQIQIFNRWGVQIFESTNSTVGWDGKFNGQLLTNDVYTYKVEADLVNSNKSAAIKHISLKGNVMLVN